MLPLANDKLSSLYLDLRNSLDFISPEPRMLVDMVPAAVPELRVLTRQISEFRERFTLGYRLGTDIFGSVQDRERHFDEVSGQYQFALKEDDSIEIFQSREGIKVIY